MSKYIDELTELICDTVRTVFPNASLDDGYDVADDVIAKLPTIEVSEDNQVLYGADHNCILTMFGECSYNETGCGDCAVAEKIRKALSVEVSEDCISKHDIWKIIEDNAYWVRYNENSTEKGMTLTGINQALNECPLVAPTVSEDCISREWVRAKLDYISYAEKDPISIAKRIVEDAPSVVPSRAEGKWQLVNHLWECNRCQYRQNKSKPTNFCSNCGAKMRLE